MSFDYIAHHLTGAWMLLRGNADGFDHFDLTVQGFWRSFFVMIVALPFFGFALYASHSMNLEVAASAPNYDFVIPYAAYFFVFTGLGYVKWIGYLMMMGPLTRYFGAAPYYLNFVVAYNWSTLLTMLVSLPLYLAQQLGWVSIEFFYLVDFMLLFVFIAYGWFITCIALKIDKLDAAALVAVELMLFLIAGRIAASIFTAFPPEIPQM